MLATLILLTACGRNGEGGDGQAGEKLEAASIAAGLVADPAAAPLDGIWSRDTDRMCILPAGRGPARRVGVMLDYGEGQGCTAIGTMERSGAALKLTLGRAASPHGSMATPSSSRRCCHPPATPSAQAEPRCRR